MINDGHHLIGVSLCFGVIVGTYFRTHQNVAVRETEWNTKWKGERAKEHKRQSNFDYEAIFKYHFLSMMWLCFCCDLSPAVKRWSDFICRIALSVYFRLDTPTYTGSMILFFLCTKNIVPDSSVNVLVLFSSILPLAAGEKTKQSHTITLVINALIKET